MQHDTKYGKSVEKKLKETIRDCTSKGKLSNMDREAKERFGLMLQKLQSIYCLQTKEQVYKSIIDDFNNNNGSVGAIKLTLHHCKLLANKQSPLPSFGGFFAPTVVKYCNKTIEVLEAKAKMQQ